MPIKNYVTGNVPYLVEYQPYNVGSKEICENIQQMVTFNLRPLTAPTEINYFVGAETSYVTTLIVKNVTENATLDVQVQFDRDVFIINGMDDVSTKKNSLAFTLNPENEYRSIIEIKKTDLDGNANYKEFASNIMLFITNRENGSIVVKNSQVGLLAEEYLPTQITVI